MNILGYNGDALIVLLNPQEARLLTDLLPYTEATGDIAPVLNAARQLGHARTELAILRERIDKVEEMLYREEA